MPQRVLSAGEVPVGLRWRGALSGGFNSFSLGSRWFLGFHLSCLVRFVCFLFWYGSIFYVRLMSCYLFSSFILILLVSFVVGVGGVSLAVFHWLAFLLGLDFGRRVWICSFTVAGAVHLGRLVFASVVYFLFGLSWCGGDNLLVLYHLFSTFIDSMYWGVVVCEDIVHLASFSGICGP